MTPLDWSTVGLLGKLTLISLDFFKVWARFASKKGLKLAHNLFFKWQVESFSDESRSLHLINGGRRSVQYWLMVPSFGHRGPDVLQSIY